MASYGHHGHGLGGSLSAAAEAERALPPLPPCRSEEVQGHSALVNSVAWNCTGSKLATGSDDRTARVFDVDSSGHAKPVLRLEPHQSGVVQVCWDPTSPTRLVSTTGGERDKTVRIWDTRAKNPEREIKLPLDYINVAWSGDGTHLAVGSSVSSGGKDEYKDDITLVDMRRYKTRRHKFPWEVNEFCFSPNSRYMFLTNEHGALEIYNHRQDDAHAKVRSVQAHTNDCYCLDIDASHRYLALGSKDSLISLWQLDDLICLRSIGESNSPVRTVSFSPCSSLLASGSYDHQLQISSVVTGRRLHAIGLSVGVNKVAWQTCRDSRLVAFARDTKSDAGRPASRDDQGFVRLLTVPRETIAAAMAPAE